MPIQTYTGKPSIRRRNWSWWREDEGGERGGEEVGQRRNDFESDAPLSLAYRPFGRAFPQKCWQASSVKHIPHACLFFPLPCHISTPPFASPGSRPRACRNASVKSCVSLRRLTLPLPATRMPLRDATVPPPMPPPLPRRLLPPCRQPRLQNRLPGYLRLLRPNKLHTRPPPPPPPPPSQVS